MSEPGLSISGHCKHCHKPTLLAEQLIYGQRCENCWVAAYVDHSSPRRYHLIPTLAEYLAGYELLSQ